MHYDPPFDHEAWLRPPTNFVGRKDDLAWVMEHLRPGREAAVTALGGMGGIGKTALAAMAVQKLRQQGHFRDGVVVVLCSKRADAADVLQRVLARFDQERRTPETGDLGDLARRMLAQKEVLVVLDDVEPGLDVERVVAPLQAVGATLLLTARQVLAHAAVPMESSRRLDLLSSREALDLFASSFGRESAVTLSLGEHSAGERIVAALGQHTLAIKLTGTYAADVNRDLVTLANELETDPLKPPDGETPRAVELAFGKSFEGLSLEAKQLFAALASLPTAEFGRQVAILLARKLCLVEPEETLDPLIFRALVEETVNEAMPQEGDRERLRLHPLLRKLALVKTMLSADEHQEIQRQYATHYKSVAETAENLYLMGGESTMHGLTLFDVEWDNIQRGQVWATEHFLDDLVARKLAAEYPDAATNCLALRLSTAERIRWLETGVEASRLMADRRLEAAHLGNLGSCYSSKGDFVRAITAYRDALPILRALSDRVCESRILGNMGNTYAAAGNYHFAIDCVERALQVSREIGSTPRTDVHCSNIQRTNGYLLRSLGFLSIKTGQFERALDIATQALTIAQTLQDFRLEAVVWLDLGTVYFHTGDLTRSIEAYMHAVKIAQELRDEQCEANGQVNLALALERLGRRAEMVIAARTAQDIYERLGNVKAAEVAAYLQKGA